MKDKLKAMHENATDREGTGTVIPTLVTFVGAIPEMDIAAITNHVRERLKPAIPETLIAWYRLQSLDELSPNNIFDVIGPSLTLEFYEDLVSLGYLSSLPSKQEPMAFQVIVVSDFSDEDNATHVQLLNQLANTVQKVISGRVKIRFALILLGKEGLDPSSLPLYSHKFRLQDRTLDGWSVRRAVAWEVCENLIVGLTTSDIGEMITSSLETDRKNVGWIWIGASALVADVTSMQEFVRLNLLDYFIGPLLEFDLKGSDYRILDNFALEWVETFQRNVLDHALEIASAQGWNIEAKGVVINKIAIGAWSQGVMGGLHSIIELSARIANEYKLFRNSLKKNLAGVERSQYFQIQNSIRDLLYSSTANNPTPIGQSEPESTIRRGLRAAAYASERVTLHLRDRPDAIYSDSQPLAIDSDRYLERVAQINVESISRTFMRYQRLSRVSLTALGALLRLLPTWIAMTFLIKAYLGWSDLQALGSSAVFTLLVGIFDQIAWRSVQLGLRLEVDKTLQQQVCQSIMGLLLKTMRDFRLQALAHLQRNSYVLRDLVTSLERTKIETATRIAEIRDRFDTSNRDASSIYTMADLEACLDLTERAMKAGASATEIKSLMSQDVLKKPDYSLYSLLSRIITLANEETSKILDLDDIDVYSLADTTEPLAGAKKWEWLYRKAIPLGDRVGRRDRGFTVFAIPAKAVRPALQERSKGQWQDDWIVANSSQSLEIGCFRYIIERS